MFYYRACDLNLVKETLPLALLVSLVFIQPASAYIDPSTGSYVLQLAMGFLFSAIFSIKTLIKRFSFKHTERRD